MLNTPILLIVFNRPAETNIVFEQIKKIKPKHLYIAADGPRINHETDSLRCHEVKSIFEKIDWDCQVERLFHENNLGCKKAVSQAIT